MCDWRTTCPVISHYSPESRQIERTEQPVYYWTIKIVKWVTATTSPVLLLVKDNVLWTMVSFAARSSTSHHKERTSSIYSAKHSTDHPHHPQAFTTQGYAARTITSRMCSGAQLSGLYFYLFKFSTSHNFLLPPNNRGDLGPRPFSHSPAPLIQHGHSALLLLSSSVWTTRIFVFGMRESPSGRLELSRSAFHLCHTKLDEQTYIWLLAYLLCVYVICGSWFSIMILYWVTDR